MKYLLLSAVAWLLITHPQAASASEDGDCVDQGGLFGVSQTCHYTYTGLIDAASHSPSSVRYQVKMVCLADNPDGLCSNPRVCQDPPGSVLFDVFRSINGGDFVAVGDVCLLSGQAQDFGAQITIDMIESAFTNLDWPTSPVVIEPPDGRTLVNLATNFRTTNTQPTSQLVPMIGHDVEIEATPTRWIWHFGDGADDTTTTPGAAYPDLQITHDYLDAHVTVHPSVDTVYHGRYRVDGGEWQDIPTERTIAGTPVDLQVLEARPVLVGSDG